MSASNYVHVEVDVVEKETENAFLFVIDGEEFWVPKSQVADADSYAEGDKNASVSITKWIAEKVGINEC